MSFPRLVANALCLELANTVNRWPAPERDLLDDAGAARAWAALALDGPVRTLTDDDLDRWRALRADVRGAFVPVAQGEPAAAEALDRLLAAHAAALRAASWEPSGAAYALVWPSPAGGVDVAGQVAASAVDLLTRGPLERVGECPSCGWLFLDTSRNGRRAWCSMDMCGGRVKSRRYYERRHDSAHDH